MAADNENIEADGPTNDEGIDFDATALVQGVRDYLLRNVRENGMKKPWQKMSEKEQQLEIDRANDKAEGLVRSIVDRVAQGDFPVVHAIVDSFNIKGGEVKIVAKGIADNEVLLTLNSAGQKAVKIVVADADQFDQTRSNIKADPDEPGLPGVKQEIDPADLKGEPGFEDDADDDPGFDDDAEQAAGEKTLGITEHSDQWWGGYNSRMGGIERKLNPFDGRKVEGKDWAAGWDAADENPEAPALGGGETPDHDPETGEIIEDEGGGDPEPEADDADAGFDDAPFEEDDPEDAIGETDTAGISTGEDRGEAPADDGWAPLTAEGEEAEREKGRNARRLGFSPAKNPNPPTSPAHRAWADGYNEAKDEGAGFDD